ncbi:MAG: PRC-barrel domain-containing protein [Chitinophagaceae bacterium]|nr:PRC-barrel domain-containing protein [Chitinophagaceae bacterium]
METNNSFNRLRELRGSGYEIADGEPDIIGWSIRDTNDRKIGVVNDLLFEPEQQKVRYIVANLRDNDFGIDRRKVLIPIGIALLHENNDDVILNSTSAWQIRALPTYDRNMTDQDERDIFTIFSTTNTSLTNTDSQPYRNIYEHINYNYDNLFRNRRKENRPNKTFGIKQRETNGADSMQSPDYNREHQYINGERLLDRIRNVKNDLNEIERDLRNNREF